MPFRHPAHHHGSSRAATRQAGIALVTAIIATALMSAMLIGFISMVGADQRSGFINRDQTSAYAAAHAGLEQLTADLGALFATNFRPTGAQVTALAGNPPALPGVEFREPGGAAGSGYQITFDDTTPADGFPDTEAQPRTISSGPYQGLMGTVTPYSIEVTAQTQSGAETRMRRTMQTVLIPAFQFGIFSDNDLNFHAGPSFDFGGRVHTNGNLFLAEGGGNTLWLRDRVTAVGEVVRRNLINGWPTTSVYTGTVRIARYPGDTTGVTMSTTQGSWLGATGAIPPPPQEGVIPSPGSNDPAWTTFSVTTTNGNIKNARTGARPLILPLVQMGAEPIDLIRRPVVNSNEDVANAPVFGQRYFARASLRILLSDTEDDLLDLPTLTATPPVDLSTLDITAPTPRGPTAQSPPHPVACYSGSALSGSYGACSGLPSNPNSDSRYYAASGAWLLPGTPLITGFLKIELQRADGTWTDVTTDILQLGYTGRRLSNTNPRNAFQGGYAYSEANYYLNDLAWSSAPGGAVPACAEPHPDAVIRIQRIRDDHAPTSTTCGNTRPGHVTPRAIDLIPNVLFDAREGSLRSSYPVTTPFVFLGGVMHYVELDLQNLARWLAGEIGAGGFGPQAEFGDGGYLVYFSDRRGNQRINNRETGEFGFEDFVNPSDASNGFPNGVLDAGEDVNGVDADSDGSNLDVYGADPEVPLAVRSNATSYSQALAAAGPESRAWTREARSNPPLFFRRALKMVNAAGRAGNAAVSPLTLLPTGRGLTIVSENPAYIQGNYNTGTGGTFGANQTDHRPSAVIADAVTLLSNNWNDIRSFTYRDTGGTTRYGAQDKRVRAASESWYRLAIVSGKGRTFPHPTWEVSDESFGSDGGAHNFLRFLENWAGQTVHYRGSMVSFYTNRQGVGTFKYGDYTPYGAPVRDYRFDTEFLQLSLLPPKSPAFRDVNTLTFRQILRPTQ